jgi:uncharacterized YigZ family protein
MRYLKEQTTYQFEVNKSLFIAVLWPITDKQMLLDALSKTKQLYPNANHYCSASIYHEGSHATQDDDGEPQRTAGFPILEVLKHHDVTDLLCVVVRYFGGIKLGAGGLVRSYTKAAAEVMKIATFYTKKTVFVFRITFGYHLISTIDAFVQKKGNVIEKEFLKDVSYRIILNSDSKEDLDEIKHLLNETTYLGTETLLLDIKP